MRYWLKLVIVYWWARATQFEPQHGAVPGFIYALPWMIALWALIVLGVRKLLFG